MADLDPPRVTAERPNFDPTGHYARRTCSPVKLAVAAGPPPNYVRNEWGGGPKRLMIVGHL